MLSLMRKHAGAWIIKVLLGAIVVVFVFWGVGSWTSQRLSRIASVNGSWITADQYQASYNNLVEQVRQTFGKNLTEDLLKTLQLKKRALDQLIDKQLMLQAADQLNLRVSDEELVQSIRSIPWFQTVAGAFDGRRYRDVLTRLRLAPEEFEDTHRETLLIEKLQSVITDTIKVSDLEATQWYQWQNAQVRVDYAVFDPQRYAPAAPTAEELAIFFEQRQESYRTDEQRKVRYLVYPPAAYASQADISEDELRDYYETNAADFKSPQTVEARHILIKVAADAGAQDDAAAKTAIENILKMARAGQDFAELAKQYSQDATKDNGGYLGAFQKESMVAPFAEKAFAMHPGEISDPVRTQFGWHIIKVEKVNPASTKSFADARTAIEQTLRDERARTLAYESAEAAYDAVYAGESLESIAAQGTREVMETDFFTRQSPPAGINAGASFAAVAFALADNDVSDVQDFEDGYYLMQVIAKIPSSLPELASVQKEATADWVNAKQAEMARADADKMLAELKNGHAFEDVCATFGVTPARTEAFKRTDAIPGIGFEPEINRVAFSLAPTGPLPDEPLKGPNGFYVLRLGERLPAPMDGFEKEKPALVQRVLQQKKRRIFDAWLTDARNKASISIVEKFQEG